MTQSLHWFTNPRASCLHWPDEQCGVVFNEENNSTHLVQRIVIDLISIIDDKPGKLTNQDITNHELFHDRLDQNSMNRLLHDLANLGILVYR